MRDKLIDILAPAWIAEQKAYGQLGDTCRAICILDRVRDRDPRMVLQVILRVLALEDDPEVLGVLAAGPLEDILQWSGPAVIEEVEACARRDPRFRDLLGGIWLSADDELFDRVHAAAGNPARMRNWRQDLTDTW